MHNVSTREIQAPSIQELRFKFQLQHSSPVGHGTLRWKNVISSTLIALVHSASLVEAEPNGGQVVTGTASITQSGTTTTINQTTQNLSLNWKSFDIAPTETVNFVQPSASSIAVNRIFDINGTQILGRLNANGQVYLINPNGILFGRGALVNVGALAASTLDFNDASLNDTTRVFSGNGAGSIVNQGEINATGSGGYVALLGNTVSNQGAITAQQGTVALGAGSATTLTFQNNSIIKMQIDQSVLNTLAENGGLIRADGGRVLMNAGAKDALLASVVNNTGVIEAHTMQEHNGTIILGGMTAGTVNVSGTLDASAPNGGNGGFIETSAAHVKIADDVKITTAAPEGNAGTWLIDPTDYTIAAVDPLNGTSYMSNSALETSLDSTNVIIQTLSTGTGNGDIFVNSAVTWAANKLTLSAYGDININADLNATSTTSLALNYGLGAPALDNTSQITTTNAAANLAGTTSYTTTQGSNGVEKAYTVITTLDQLQGMSSNVAANCVLGSNIDATATSTWNTASGFTPILGFTGTFDGLGHTVSGLFMDKGATENIGLIGSAGIGSKIRNVGLVGGSVTGGASTGALVGSNGTGAVYNSYSTGNVSGAAGTGGLIGANTTGTISNSYATGNVSNGVAAGAGGLVGSNTEGTITSSYATGKIMGGASSGGLLGANTTGTISNSYATGSVTGAAGTGGLLGVGTSGVITNSYATGLIAGSGAGRGGLVGTTGAAHVGSFWNKETTGMTTSLGGVGVVGMTTAQMKDPLNFTTATTANNGVNPAWNTTSIWTLNSMNYPLLTSLFKNVATVTANNLTQAYQGAAYTSGYTASTVMATGLAGTLSGTLIYSGTSQTGLNAGSYVITPGGLTYGSIDNPQNTITFVDGRLDITPKALTATIAAASKVYDGTLTAAPVFTVAGLVGTETVTATGAATFNTADVTTANLITANSNALTDGTNGGLASNYSLATGQTVASTITTKALTITGMAAINKTYDDSTVASLTGGLLSTGIAGETLTFTGQTGTFADQNVANGIVVTVADTTLVSGTGLASNYSVVQPTGLTANITALPSVPDDSVSDVPTDSSTIVNDTVSAQDLIFMLPGAYRINMLRKVYGNKHRSTSLLTYEPEEPAEPAEPK